MQWVSLQHIDASRGNTCIAASLAVSTQYDPDTLERDGNCSPGHVGITYVQGFTLSALIVVLHSDPLLCLLRHSWSMLTHRKRT